MSERSRLAGSTIAVAAVAGLLALAAGIWISRDNIELAPAGLESGEEKSAPPEWAPKAEAVEKLSENEMEALVLQLRSPNKNPNPDFSSLAEYPDDYDWKGQQAVDAAMEKLTAQGMRAFPVLIRHSEDSEFCMAYPVAVLSGFSVGDICLQIMEGHVDLIGISYKFRDGGDGKQWSGLSYFASLEGATRKEKLGIWWAARKHRALRELQIEVLKWRLEREREIGFPGARDREFYLDPIVEKLRELEVP